VAVVGAGSLGLFAVQLARILGAGRVFALDLSAHRLEVAAGLGAIPVQAGDEHESLAAVLGATGGRGVDLVVEASGAASAQAQALRLARKGGRVVFLGLPHREVLLPPAVFARLVRGEIGLAGPWNSYSAPFPGVEWHANVAYMASGQLRTELLVSRRVALREAGSAYRLVANQAVSVIKVVLTGGHDA
jgi:L-iditol 2-dehydrogenase